MSGRTWNIIAALLGIVAGMIAAFAALISRPTAANIVAPFGFYSFGGLRRGLARGRN